MVINITKTFFVIALMFASFVGVKAQPPQVMSANDLSSFETPEPDFKIFYGNDPLQYGELRLPDGDGPHPIMMFIHGGCWLSQYDIMHSRKLTEAFRKAGIATWSIEYRRVGNEGGGWPGTFKDVANAGDFLSEIAGEHNLNLNQFITSGHSAGGHFALWYANRPNGFKTEASINPIGVLALAPAPDLENLHDKKVCGHVIDKLMGGGPLDVPERYKAGSGMSNIPLSTPQNIIIGAYDQGFGPSGKAYLEAATKKGAPVKLIDAPLSGHFEMIDPESQTWPLVINAAKNLLKPRAKS